MFFSNYINQIVCAQSERILTQYEIGRYVCHNIIISCVLSSTFTRFMRNQSLNFQLCRTEFFIICALRGVFFGGILVFGNTGKLHRFRLKFFLPVVIVIVFVILVFFINLCTKLRFDKISSGQKSSNNLNPNNFCILIYQI